MGCGASKSTETTPEATISETNGKNIPPNSVEAEDAANNETEATEKNEESIIRKHPPKPSQRLEEQPQTILTAADLTENELATSAETTEQESDPAPPESNESAEKDNVAESPTEETSAENE